MKTRGLKTVIEYLQQTLPQDGQLLASFVAVRDEAAFAALVRRHGRMVFGVCQRVLRHTQDAEDAFQATFLILARKAASVMKRESLSSWLYRVAYRTALEARAARLRRQQREMQVENLPHPAVEPEDLLDWHPLLDRELNRLSEKYRQVVVLCDLEGQSRKEAAKLLGLAEGTLSSRLATARRMLAKKLARYGLALSGGALATALAAEASAAVPASLMGSTVRAALLVAAGQWAVVSTSAALLMQGVIKAMFLKKLKIVLAIVMVAVALGASSFSYRAAEPGAPAAAKPPSELEALRKENELLRLNLLVVLEKVRAQEAELAAVRGKATPAWGRVQPQEELRIELPEAEAKLKADKEAKLKAAAESERMAQERLRLYRELVIRKRVQDHVQEAEAALQALRKANDPEAKRRALEKLDEALKNLHKSDEANSSNKQGSPQGK
jgi:RNA polymerase sigma factor (sigma-70 family)